MVRVSLQGGHTPSDTIVFILGAGASAPFNLPVMAGFMNRARRNFQRLEPGCEMQRFHEWMFSFWKRCRDASWAFIRHWDNIEELYTQADLLRLMDLPPGDDCDEGETSENLCKAISWCIWDVYRQFQGIPRWVEIANQVHEAGMKSVFITTNYDLCVESSFAQKRGQWSYVYPGFTNPIENSFMRELDGGDVMPAKFGSLEVPIVKLHGSVNWFRDTAGTFVAVNQVAAPTKEGRPTGFPMEHEEAKSLVMQHAGRTWEYLSPAIIPPMLGKSSSSPVIQANWRAAVEAIGSARSVYVIGYSFPATDAFMLRLLTEGMARNRDFEKLMIIDRSTRESWDDRITTMFEPMFQRQDMSFISMNAKHAISIMCGYAQHDWQNELHKQSERLGLS